MTRNKMQKFLQIKHAWEQRKLGQLVSIGTGKDYKHLLPGTIPVYGTGGYMLSVNQALSEKENAVGIGRKGTINKPYILKAPFWTVDTLFYVLPRKDLIRLPFLYACFQKINWSAKDESTGVPSLTKKAIEETDVTIPSIEEQEEIGNLMSLLDDTIALHQRE